MLRLTTPKRVVNRVVSRMELLAHDGRFNPLRREDDEVLKKKIRADVMGANNGNPRAFARLCKRDPRYLGTEMAAIYVLDAKLSIVFSGMRHPLPGTRTALETRSLQIQEMRKAHIRENVAKAHEFLDHLARSINATTSGGLNSYVSRSLIVTMLDKEYANVARAKRLSEQPAITARKLARSSGLDDDHARMLLQRPRAWRQIARQRVGRQFGTDDWNLVARWEREGRSQQKSKPRRAAASS